MPVVLKAGKIVKRFPYTSEGQAAAKALARKVGGTVQESQGAEGGTPSPFQRIQAGFEKRQQAQAKGADTKVPPAKGKPAPPKDKKPAEAGRGGRARPY